MSHGRIDSRYLVVGTLLSLASIITFGALAAKHGEDFAIPALAALTIVGVVIFRGPVGKAMARRLEEGTQREPSPELLNELDDVRGRLLELEERLDFTERMLSKAREPERVSGPRG